MFESWCGQLYADVCIFVDVCKHFSSLNPKPLNQQSWSLREDIAGEGHRRVLGVPRTSPSPVWARACHRRGCWGGEVFVIVKPKPITHFLWEAGGGRVRHKIVQVWAYSYYVRLLFGLWLAFGPLLIMQARAFWRRVLCLECALNQLLKYFLDFQETGYLTCIGK